MGAYNTMDVGVAGLLEGFDHVKVSRVCSVECAFGAAAYFPTNDGDTAHSTHVLNLVPDGVFAFVQKFPGKYEAQDVATIVRTGLVYVPVAAAVQANTQVYLTSAGVWTGTVGTNTVCKAKFRSSTSGAGLALIELFDN